jgi:PPOX class probable F420-dependent enzyme
MPSLVLEDDERRFVESARVGRLASSTADGRPHVIPVCFELLGDDIYIGLDAKPKSVDVLRLRRVRNISSNPQAAFVVDRYSEDWTQLGYVLVDAESTLVQDEAERSRAIQSLRRKYVQYLTLLPDNAPVIRLRPRRVISWGDLTPWEPASGMRVEGSSLENAGRVVRGIALADV